jgi:glycosyltransferase involved in cell wall biosynthesis
LEKLKILFLIPSLTNAGPIRVVQSLVDHLNDSYIDCEVWYFDTNEGLKFSCTTRKVNLNCIFRIKSFDVIHSHGIRPDFFVAFIKILGFKIVSVTTSHNIMSDDLYYQYNWFISKVFTKVWIFLWNFQNKVVVLSNQALEYYRNYISSDKLEVIGNGLPDCKTGPFIDNDYSIIQRIKKEYFVLGSCCFVTKRKGLEQIIQLLKLNNYLALVLVGSGPELNNLEQEAINLNVRDRCLFLGYRSNAQDYYPFFDVVVIPSRSEGFPLLLIEALRASKPVLLSEIPIFREIADSSFAVFFQLDNIPSLNNSLMEIFPIINEFGFNARKKFEVDLTVEKMAGRYMELYKRVARFNLNELL